MKVNSVTSPRSHFYCHGKNSATMLPSHLTLPEQRRQGKAACAHLGGLSGVTLHLYVLCYFPEKSNHLNQSFQRPQLASIVNLTRLGRASLSWGIHAIWLQVYGSVCGGIFLITNCSGHPSAGGAAPSQMVLGGMRSQEEDAMRIWELLWSCSEHSRDEKIKAQPSHTWKRITMLAINAREEGI